MEKQTIELQIAFTTLAEKYEKFADTDYTKGQKLGDSRKQGQYELMMAGQSLAYATAAKEIRNILSCL